MENTLFLCSVLHMAVLRLVRILTRETTYNVPDARYNDAGVAQLVVHHPRSVEVRGSTPLASSILDNMKVTGEK